MATNSETKSEDFRPYGSFNQKDIARMEIRQVNAMICFLNTSQKLAPEYRRHLKMSEIKLGLAFGRYLNELNRLTIYHNVRQKKGVEPHFTHISKVIAYLVKWMLIENPVYSDIQWNLFSKIEDKKTKGILLYPNILFVVDFILYMLGIEEPKSIVEDESKKRLFGDLVYHMTKGAYSEKYAATTFYAYLMSRTK